ncbi:MAG: ABC transporter substrate-binding protein [Dehalococcoidia bacterium]
MKTIRLAGLSGKVWVVPLTLLLAALAVIPLIAACGEEEEEGVGTPTATPTAAATGTATPSASPGVHGPGVTDTQIILGMHATLSGSTGAVYKMVTDSLLSYIKYVNTEKGGVCGRELVIIRYDDGGDYSKALQVTRKLVEEDKVLAMVGCLGPHDAAVEYLNENGIPDLMIFSFAEKLSDPEEYPWVTVSVGSWYLEGRNFAIYIKEQYPGKKVGILYVNTGAGRDQLQGLQEHLDPGNLLVAAESFEETAVSVRSQMLKLKDAGAEVVVLTTSIPFTAQALKEAQRMNWKPVFLLEYGNSDPLLFNYVPAELVEGAIAFHAFKMPEWTDDPAVAEHHRIMAQYGGPAPSIFTILMHNIGEILVETLNRTCDDLSHEGVMNAMLSFEDRSWCPSLLYPGTCIDTSPTDHRVISEGIMSQVVLENGKPVWKELGRIMDFEPEEE